MPYCEHFVQLFPVQHSPSRNQLISNQQSAYLNVALIDDPSAFTVVDRSPGTASLFLVAFSHYIQKLYYILIYYRLWRQHVLEYLDFLETRFVQSF